MSRVAEQDQLHWNKETISERVAAVGDGEASLSSHHTSSQHEYTVSKAAESSSPTPHVSGGDSSSQTPDEDNSLIKVYTFGRFGILQGTSSSRVVRSRANSRPVQLLKCLICLGGREVSQVRVTEALWPQAEGDAARRSLDTTVYRLRKFLGEPKAVCFEDGALTLDSFYVWVDVWTAERLISQLEYQLQHSDSYISAHDVENQWHLLKGIYGGPFLREAVDEPWAFALRERLHSRILKLIEQLGALWERLGDDAKAQACYEWGIDLDPAVERFYRRLMRLYQRQGRIQEAKSIYARCRTALHKLLDVAPSPRTCAVFERL